MRRFLLLIGGLGVALLAFGIFASESFSDQPLTISYDVFLTDRANHFFDVYLTLENVNTPSIRLALPAWSNLYQIRDFAQYVQRFQAFNSAGEPLRFWKIDKQTWHIEASGGQYLSPRSLGEGSGQGLPGQGPWVRVNLPGRETNSRKVVISYRVFANELSPFSAQLDDRHAFLNGALIFMYVVGGRDLPVTVTFHPPKGWKIATALKKDPQNPYRFYATSYDQLVDCPVEIGAFERHQFEVGGATYEVVLFDYRGEFRIENFLSMIRKIVSYQTLDLMRDVPFNRYVFIFHLIDEYGSGMEHSNSAVISFNRERVRRDVFDVAGIIAHEFFHVWNVKRIKPVGLFRYDFTRENYTRALWFCEGVTSYYAAMTRFRTGFWNRDQLYAHLSERITALQNRPARKIQSVEEASFHAWFEKYPWYQRPENSISYYCKGELLGFLLDLKIREVTDNQRSLDDVMRFMNWWFGKRRVGFRDSEDILWVINSLAQTDFSKFFDKYIRGTEELPYQECLAFAGLKLREEVVSVPDPGFHAERNFDQPMTVNRVVSGGPAQKAGLQVGDEIVAINGKSPGLYLRDSFQGLQKGDPVEIRIRRGSVERILRFQLGGKESRSYHILEDPHATERQRRIRQGWLKGVTEGEKTLD